MSGHSKWAQIKYKKSISDIKRGQLFSKISRLIYVAIKEKGVNLEANPQLKSAIEKAKEVGMPKENIERIIQKARGGEGEKVEPILLEAYGPQGVAILMGVITDNKNRTINEIKHILTTHNSRLAEIGSVKWNFDFDQQTREWKPKYEIELNPEDRERIEKLFEDLDNQEDVEEIYSNLKE